jgi:proliferating cell nuclear antigen
MVAAVDFKISSSAFEEYEIDKEQSIGLDIPNFLSVLKRASAQDKATFTLQDSKLEIVLENSSRRRFVLPLLDLSQEEVPRIDQLEFSTKASLSSDVLESGIADAEVVADAVVFEASPSRFVMRAEGDISSTQLELEKGNKALAELKAAGSVRARYPLDYLKKMIKAAKLSDSVVLEWAQDYPLKMSFEVEGKLSLNFVLAPRVEE